MHDKRRIVVLGPTGDCEADAARAWLGSQVLRVEGFSRTVLPFRLEKKTKLKEERRKTEWWSFKAFCGELFVYLLKRNITLRFLNQGAVLITYKTVCIQNKLFLII